MVPLSRRNALRGGFACILGGLAGCVGGDSLPFSSADSESVQSVDGWPQFQRDASNSGFSSALSARKRYDTSRWQIEVDTGTNGYGGVANPVVHDDSLYVGERKADRYHITALQTRDASREWSQPLRGRNETPAVVDGTVFVPTTNVVETNRIAAFAAEDGAERWHFDFGGGRVTAITSRDGRLYFGQKATADGTSPARVFALSDDGERLWRTQVDGDVAAPVAVGPQLVFVGGTDERLRAQNVETGETEWTFQTDSAIRCAPAVANESVFVANEAGEVYSVSTDGEQRWRTSATAPGPSGGLAVTSESVFVGGKDGLFALKKTDGTQQWSFDANGRVTTPTASGGTVYVGVDDALVAVESGAGEVAWQREISSVQSGDTIIQGVTSAASIADGGFYVGTVSGLHRFVSA